MREQQAQLCHLAVQINGHRFLVDQRKLCSFSGRLRALAKEGASVLEMEGFPGGSEGFELAVRFCYNKGRIVMNPSNISLIHCAAVFLEMTEELSPCNLISQAETFLDGLFYWTWHEVLSSLKSCETFLSSADASGLLQRLTSSLLAKMSANSDVPIFSTSPFSSTPSPSSSPEATGFRASAGIAREWWWFDDLTTLHPKIIEKITSVLGACGAENKNLMLTRFLLHYLKCAAHGGTKNNRSDYGGLADTAVHGVISVGRTAFSCRGLFWVLRVVSCMGLSADCRQKLESLMGSVLDHATLDDLLVSGPHEAVYDVDLVLRLVKIFVGNEDVRSSPTRIKKIGILMNKYLGEVSPDQCLKASKFQSLAESLPDSARDCFDDVYRALDIYLESHPALSVEERARLCRCLNYEKLSMEVCRELAKNPRVPPRAAVRALLVSQQRQQEAACVEAPRAGVYERRVVELKKTCREMQSAGKRAVNCGSSPSHHLHHTQRAGKGLPRLC